MSKTIVLAGCGRPGSWAEKYYNMHIDAGNNVYLISHKDYGKPNTCVVDWLDPISASETFKSFIENIPHIDLLLFNQNGPSYPNQADHFVAGASVSVDSMHANFNTKVVTPHLMTVAALEKMNITSSVVFVSSGMGFEMPRPHSEASSGYASANAAVNQMMFSFAKCNNKQVDFAALIPFFNYNDPEQIERATQQVWKDTMEKGIPNGAYIYCA